MTAQIQLLASRKGCRTGNIIPGKHGLQHELGEQVALRPLTKTHPRPTNGIRHPWTDDTRLPFYRVVQIPILIRAVKLEEIFVVSKTNKDAIFG